MYSTIYTQFNYINSHKLLNISSAHIQLRTQHKRFDCARTAKWSIVVFVQTRLIQLAWDIKARIARVVLCITLHGWTASAPLMLPERCVHYAVYGEQIHYCFYERLPLIKLWKSEIIKWGTLYLSTCNAATFLFYLFMKKTKWTRIHRDKTIAERNRGRVYN